MTAAGVCGLYIAGLDANDNKQQLERDDRRRRQVRHLPGRRRHRQGDALARPGVPVHRTPPHTFYNVYGIERVGRLSGQRFIGDHDWYREGCEC